MNILVGYTMCIRCHRRMPVDLHSDICDLCYDAILEQEQEATA